MKVSIIPTATTEYDTKVFDMPKQSFGIDAKGDVFYRSFNSVHRFNAAPESWENRFHSVEMPAVMVRKLMKGEKVVIEI